MNNGEDDISWAEMILRDVIEKRDHNGRSEQLDYMDLLPGIYDYEMSSAIEDAADIFDAMSPAKENNV